MCVGGGGGETGLQQSWESGAKWENEEVKRELVRKGKKTKMKG